MSLPVIITPKARQDLFDIADYLAGQSLETAMCFLDHAEASFDAQNSSKTARVIFRMV